MEIYAIILIASFTLLALTGFVLFWFNIIIVNEKVTKAAKWIMLILGIFLILALAIDGKLFKDIPHWIDNVIW